MLLPFFSRRMWVPALLACWGSLPATGQSSAVQRYVKAAAQLYENLEYERALEQLGRAKSLAGGINDDVSIGLYEGIIMADMGRKDESSAAFRTALLLKPDAQLPVRVSPKVEQNFENLRSEVQKELASNLARQGAEQPKGSDRPEQIRASADRLKPPYPPDSGLTSTSTGGAFKQALPYGLVGATAVAGGIGAYFGVRSRNRVTSARGAASQESAQTFLRQANSDATVANVLFATTATAALGAVITYLLRDSESTEAF